jgi:hypothetical protein
MLPRQIYHSVYHWSLNLLSNIYSYLSKNNQNSGKHFRLMISLLLKKKMIFDISSKTPQISYTYITWFYLCNKESPEQKTLAHFFQYAYVFRRFNLKWLLGRMQWVICDFRINRTPSLVFDWWKYYSVLTYLWMQYVWWREKGHIGSRTK